MPRVNGYTPAWLCRPSPGFHLFNPNPQTQEGSARRTNGYTSQVDYMGPNRTIARRDTEVFVVVGKQIRWADLPSFKDQWQIIRDTPSKKPKVKVETESEESNEFAPKDGSYRVLKASIGEPIRQLCISPNQKLMAIATSHTVHIAILPQPELLNAHHNKEPLKLKTYTIGPTTHVLSQSSLASVLWHPLGEGGHCLVTITTDAIVRLWEFDIDNRWSADSPALALDLKKLLVATSEQDDVAPYRSNRNKVFTSDAAGMDVSSACFGGAGYGDESPWSAMTLWIAMSSGDVYALCPLLPARFQPHTDLLPALSTAVMEKKAFAGEAALPSDDQTKWVCDLDNQQPIVREDDGQSISVEVYKRPTSLSAIPRIQGPFQLLPEDAEDTLELSDIHVVPAKADEATDDSEADFESELEKEDDEGISASLVCLMTREGRVYVCLDLEGVEGQWLPQKVPAKPPPSPPDPYLVVLEGLDTLKVGEESPTEWPTFTQDVESRYSFFTTHSHGVYYFSFSPWLHNLEKELRNEDSTGVQFRLNMFRNNINTARERILSFNQPDESSFDSSVPACLAMQDSDLGYFLLTSFNSQPQAATLDQPYLTPLPNGANTAEYSPEIDSFIPNVAYPPYQPPAALYAPSALPTFTQKHIPPRHKHLLKDDIRLSTATLDIMTEAHRILSRETHQLGVAAADLFRRCEQLLEVFRNQILKAGEVAERVDQVTSGPDVEEGEKRKSLTEAMEERIERARSKQQSLGQRCEELKRKVKELGGREMSLREREWVREIEGVGNTVLGRRKENEKEAEDGEGDDEEEEEEEEEEEKEEVKDGGVDEDATNEDEDDAEHHRRFREVQRLAQDLLQRAKDIAPENEDSPDKDDGDRAQSPIPSNLRKKKIAEVKKLLEKETMLVNDTQAKLEQLSLAALA